MPKKAVADAIDARLAAYWVATPVIDYDTTTEPPDDEDAFLVVQYPIANGVRPVLGRTFWEEGAIRFVLHVKRGIGKEQGLEWSDTLAHMFRAVRFQDIRIQTFEPDGPIIDDASYDGNWVIYATIVPYRFEFEEAVFEFASA
jgi:hypothetical protein